MNLFCKTKSKWWYLVLPRIVNYINKNVIAILCHCILYLGIKYIHLLIHYQCRQQYIFPQFWCTYLLWIPRKRRNIDKNVWGTHRVNRFYDSKKTLCLGFRLQASDSLDKAAILWHNFSFFCSLLLLLLSLSFFLSLFTIFCSVIERKKLFMNLCFVALV